MRHFWLSFAAALAALGAAESGAITNIVFPGKTNGDSLGGSGHGRPPATATTKDVREPGREKLDGWNGERDITDILGTVAGHDGGGCSSLRCRCTPLTFVAQNGINGDCRTAYRGHKWCYVSEDSDCRDARKSKKFPQLSWSHYGCKARRETLPPTRRRPQPPPPPPTLPGDIGRVIRPRVSLTYDEGGDDDVAEEEKEGGLLDVVAAEATTVSDGKEEEEEEEEDEVVFDP